ncbi:S-methyl-5-thioribose kinase [Gluconacetobacter sp. 1b LMG 1731]|uniref:S-methyl-5-thioribose kinase n=1 Tax=Gluconacetobacter dulcium TaxID=2729096 RepID=A0A7W4NTK6_9PROT|nr:S-methyl-5-thioribose kinase [Gluconacetobacter dulcium]MBB2165791.1 S-methyl-5-thioribose kinase [Gluconacetobacter dulcium]MBB2194943.1 S-methyl-5-thioribose kinase [Gluconacetobacter dulcium]
MTRSPTPYRTLDPAGIRAFLAAQPALATRLGGQPDAWRVREVSDGNLNNVFLIDGPAGGVCFKQSLPHVRVDPDWKMPLDRTAFEAAYLRAVRPHVGNLTTELLHFDPDLFVLVVESLNGHVVLRHGLMQGGDWPKAAAAIGRFVARATFHTSPLALKFEASSALLAPFARNHTLTRITVDLVLTDPYHAHPRNHWLSPELDPIVANLRADPAVRRRVGQMQARFLTCQQALLHGDLHTGSVMVADQDSRVIDGEFALPGPIGFDCGLFVGNLLMHLFATPTPEGRTRALRDITQFWTHFRQDFTTLWTNAVAHSHSGDAYAAPLFRDDPTSLQQVQTQFLDAIEADTIAFAALEIIRRLTGYAHVADFDVIADRTARAARQEAALRLAQDLLAHPEHTSTVAALSARAADRAA